MKPDPSFPKSPDRRKAGSGEPLLLLRQLWGLRPGHTKTGLSCVGCSPHVTHLWGFSSNQPPVIPPGPKWCTRPRTGHSKTGLSPAGCSLSCVILLWGFSSNQPPMTAPGQSGAHAPEQRTLPAGRQGRVGIVQVRAWPESGTDPLQAAGCVLGTRGWQSGGKAAGVAAVS